MVHDVIPEEEEDNQAYPHVLGTAQTQGDEENNGYLDDDDQEYDPEEMSPE